MGIQIARDRSTEAFPLSFQEPEGEDHDPDQHAEGVLVDEAALEEPRYPGEPADDARRAVHHHAVDHRLVAGAPEAPAERPRAAGEEPRIKLVEAVLARDDRVQRAELHGDALRQVGALEIEPPRRGDAGKRQPDGIEANPWTTNDHRPW